MSRDQNREQSYFRRRARSSGFSSLISMALVLFLLGLVGLIVIHAKNLSDHIKENLEVQVFVRDNASEAEISTIEKQITSAIFTRDVEYVSKEEAAGKLREDLGEDFVDFLGFNPLMPSFNIRLKADYANPDSMSMISNYLTSNEMVHEIEYQELLFDLINQNISKIAVVIAIICLLFFIISMVLINNSIRLSLHSRRFSIRTMQLVGATKRFIQGPFISRGIMRGGVASSMAILLLLGVLWLTDREIPELGSIRNEEMILLLLIGILLLGFFISFLSTLFSVRRYLDSSIEDLYL